MDIMIRNVPAGVKAAIIAAAAQEDRSMNNFLLRLLSEHFAPPTTGAGTGTITPPYATNSETT